MTLLVDFETRPDKGRATVSFSKYYQRYRKGSETSAPELTKTEAGRLGAATRWMKG